MLLKLFARLPLSVLYLFSWPIYFVMYHLVRYRRSVVRAHLSTAFPKYSKQELRALERQFYRNLADVVVEVIKAMDISQEEFAHRVTHKNQEVLQAVVDSGRSFMLLSLHAANWEWLQLAMGLHVPVRVESVYKRLHSPRMNRIFHDMRSRFGSVMVEAKDLMSHVVKNRKNQSAYAILADQKPRGSRCHYTQFLNRPTRFFIGPEKIAQFAKLPIVYVTMHRVARGHYEVGYELLAEPPYEKLEDQYPLTELYARRVEQSIYERPDSWLWSNRRWRVRSEEKKRAS